MGLFRSGLLGTQQWEQDVDPQRHRDEGGTRAEQDASKREIRNQQPLFPIWQAVENLSIWVHYCCKSGKVLIER
jgi:hypothetical protein